ncbi:hypothetical protein P3102_10565 [Amycolatopsis sp. QT-25]|uniref:hypothetical protein n=1 Tax=Amycolatopsis sp. QT-25 TaxID=3034022 RepID=UPI0023EDF842|nr:hypothetical protein [Amycolatopsis sp. QT-25]WET81617.1 hypothetical protein P3102_10565 [Amycolatopsis sp. QT-25]
MGGLIGVRSQRSARHDAELREQRERAAHRREILRQAVDALLVSAQEVDQVVNHRPDRDPPTIHLLWLNYHRLAIIASSQLRKPAKEFADALNEAFWHGTPDGEEVWEYLHVFRERFDTAAHRELDEEVSPSTPARDQEA